MIYSALPRLLAAAFVLLCAALPGYAEYPDRPLKVIVAWPPGGVVDTTARVVAQQ
jgi:tripartite-type tricarboxylate transporter receptor subunit TctC